MVPVTAALGSMKRQGISASVARTTLSGAGGGPVATAEGLPSGLSVLAGCPRPVALMPGARPGMVLLVGPAPMTMWCRDEVAVLMKRMYVPDCRWTVSLRMSNPAVAVSGFPSVDPS